DWSVRRFGEPVWYLDPGRVLHARAGYAVQEARDRATQEGRVETPGRVVAELSLGFWRYLLTTYYDGTLWRDTLYRAFPGQARRRVVHDAAKVVHRCRNRIAHQEPIFNKPVADIRFTALALVGWICPVSREWIERHCRTLDVL